MAARRVPLTTLHHINVASPNVGVMARFYREVLGLSSIQGKQSQVRSLDHFSGKVAFLSDGQREIHLSAIDLGVGARTGNAVNPQASGHVAFRTNEIGEVKRRLDEKGVIWSDYGEWAMKGWYQIYCFDPVGNVVEVHQVL
jgi:glyoxylase I family protein